MDQTPPHILSLGSVNADFQVRLDRRPEVSETVIGRDFLRLGGGKAANVAVLARKLGVASRLVAHVGDDDLAEQALAPLRHSGVDLTAVVAIAGATTGVAMIMVPPDGAKGIVMAANANAMWSEDEAAAAAKTVEAAPDGSMLVVDWELPGFVPETAAQAARHHGLAIVLDPSPADRVSDRLLAAADVVVPNAAEAETLTGIRCDDAISAARAAERLLRRGVAAACVKLSGGAACSLKASAPCWSKALLSMSSTPPAPAMPLPGAWRWLMPNGVGWTRRCGLPSPRPPTRSPATARKPPTRRGGNSIRWFSACPGPSLSAILDAVPSRPAILLADLPSKDRQRIAQLQSIGSS